METQLSTLITGDHVNIAQTMKNKVIELLHSGDAVVKSYGVMDLNYTSSERIQFSINEKIKLSIEIEVNK